MGLFGSSKPVCPHCRGKAKVTYKHPGGNKYDEHQAGDVAYCPACHGTGRVEKVWYKNRWEECPWPCSGTGVVISQTWRRYPDGSPNPLTLKEKRITCPTCKGKKGRWITETFFKTADSDREHKRGDGYFRQFI